MDQKDKTKIQYIRERMLEQQGEARIVRKIIMIVMLVIVVVAACVGIGGYLYVQSALKPADPDNQKIQEVEIPIGSSVGNISTILADQGIIKNAKIFKYYIKFKNESGFQAGSYKLAPSMTLPEIIKSLKTGKVVMEAQLKITIPEGKQLIQIAHIIAEKTDKDPEDVFKQLNDKNFINKLRAKYPDLLTDEIFGKNILYPLEGYLFPATYDFYEEKPSLELIVTEMLKKTDGVLAEYKDEMNEKQFSNHKLLTLASLIEEEATAKVDRDMISSVFFNRMKIDMPLQTDPTVLYAKGQHQDKVFYKDLEVNSPYNTYKNKGLTPGPIANAGTTSIEAALNPATSDYLYFLATSTGEVVFAKTLDQHNQNKAKFITNKK
ncbi:endolytic transglycosylase MltG [Bacillus cihuensis]|uniref:endolytic transglycosylase MltG n=1 Tax=Bacillus cihuensis TaxID=1208599 RepID=UPI0003F6B2BA|nr:endolytic transglycosylase MltG [Bacillus cihuensis]